MINTYSSRRGKFIYGTVIAVLLIAVALLILANIYTGNTIRKGIRIEQTDVSWLSKDEAKTRISNSLGDIINKEKMTLLYEDRKWEIKLSEIGYAMKVDEAVQQAYYIGREGSIFQKVYQSMLLSMNGQDLKVEESYEKVKLKSILKKIKTECDSIEKNAEIAYNDGKITFIKEKLNRSLDIDRNIELIENQLIERNFEDIKLIVEERKPHIVYNDIKDINGIVSYYSTQFNMGDTNRTDNIKLASSRISNRILLPGESFSMNNVLGPRTHENGYKEAPIIFKNELVPGTGGGVCQVSSTLYNSVLLAGLDVIEREHHSMPLNYISPGRDATINEDTIDFRFVNNLENPISLHAEVNGNRLNIRVLGKKREDGVEIKLKTQIIGVYSPKPDEVIVDNNLQAGQKMIERKAIKGLRVILFRESYKNGKLQRREKLTEDYYRPIQGKVRVSGSYYQVDRMSEDILE